MSTGYRQAVERKARELFRELQYNRVVRFTADQHFSSDVRRRLAQIMSGDETPIEQNADD